MREGQARLRLWAGPASWPGTRLGALHAVSKACAQDTVTGCCHCAQDTVTLHCCPGNHGHFVASSQPWKHVWVSYWIQGECWVQ